MKVAEERIEEAQRTGATTLDLSGWELPSLLESMGQLTNLKDEAAREHNHEFVRRIPLILALADDTIVRDPT